MFLAGLLLVGALPFVMGDAAAWFTESCSKNDVLDWDFTMGHSDFDGFVIKDIRFGGTDQYRIKYMNIKWMDIDVPNAGLVDLALSGTWGTPDCSTNGVATITYDPTNANADGNNGVRITFRLEYASTGSFVMKTTSSKGDDDRNHPLYIDVDCSADGNADSSDDSVRFNHTVDNGYAAQVRSESNMFGNGDHQTGRFVVDDDSVGKECLRVDSTTPATEVTTGWALYCSSCTAESTNNQYVNGPWDYLSGQSTWATNVQLVVVRQSFEAVDGTGDYLTEFRMFASVI